MFCKKMEEYMSDLGFNKKQIEQLLTYKKNSTELLFEDVYNVYQLKHLLGSMSHQQIMEYLASIANAKNIIPENVFLYDTPEYKKVREESEKELFLLQDEIKTQNTKPCQYCKSPQTIGVFVQTRSADEPMTYIVTCLACKRRQR